MGHMQVVVRCRPLNSTETKDGRGRIVEMDVQEGMVKVGRVVSNNARCIG